MHERGWLSLSASKGTCLAVIVGLMATTLYGDVLNHVVPRSPKGGNARGHLAAPADTCPLDGSQHDEGSIVVIEHDGSDYSWKTPDGIPNYAPRQCVARRFYRNHSDSYDFIVVFTNFEFETGYARAFYNLVRNDVQGIGKVVADNGLSFGSPGRLKGYVDMAAMSRWLPASGPFSPGDPAFATAMHVMTHEVGHQWLAQPRYKDAGGNISFDLLGQDGAHWSYLLDTDASHMYGADWAQLRPGHYRAERVREIYSPLDLYLAGFLPAARTPPFTLLRAPGVDTTQLPIEGAEQDATPEIIRVDDVIAAEGPRAPDATFSQKEFRLGFVFLVQPGTEPTPAEMQAAERLRDSFQGNFFAQTRGVAVADTTLAEAPAPPPLPDVDLDRALGWLLGAQSFDGRWEDLPGSAVRDTSTAMDALVQLGQTGAAYDRAAGWLSGAAAPNTDFVARRILALAPRPLDAQPKADLLAALKRSRNADGGYGPGPGYASTAVDTALALRALRALQQPAGATVAQSFSSLEALRATGGGWAAVAGRPASTLVTAEVVLAILEWPGVATAQGLLPGALQTLLQRRNADGGFGESPSTAYATALALDALSRAGLPQAQLLPPTTWLKQAQRSDGSWHGSRYETALALTALRRVFGANLVVPEDSLVFAPESAHEGDAVQVTAIVRNVGRAPADPTYAGLYLGAPGSGVLLAEVTVPGLAAGEESAVEFTFDTHDRAGTRTLYVVADARDAIQEAREDDNAASRTITIEGLLPDLEISPGAISVSPEPPVTGETVEVRVTVRNNGPRRSAAEGVLRLVLDDPRQGGRLVGTAPLPALEPGTSVTLSLPWDTSGASGHHVLYALADASYVVFETDESNNEGFLAIEVTDTPPAGTELSVAALVPDPAILTALPQTIAVSVTAKNRGLTGVPTTTVALYESNPPAGSPLLEVPVTLGPRQSKRLVLSLRLTTPGTRHLVAMIDPAGLIPEENEEDNTTTAVVVDPGGTVDLALTDLTPSSTDLVVGAPLTVSATLRNLGTATAKDVPVVLTRSAADGGAELARVVVNVAGGDAVPVTLTWTTAVTGSPLLLVLRSDPFGVFPEPDESNNDVPLSLTVRPSSLPNLHVSGADIVVVPDPPLAGGSAQVSARVTNPSVVAAGPFRVAFFAGDPSDGGRLIGDQRVAGLAAHGDATATIKWPSVDIQNVPGLFVQVDADAEVDEYDESDNVGFRPVSAIALPDFALGAGDLTLEPPFPHADQSVKWRAVVRNLGGRPSPASALRLFEGEPEAGVVVGEASLPALSPGESTEVSGVWTTGARAETTLSAVADPDAAVPEADEGNNRARLAVVVQDADLFLTAPYFSPDGDGIVDETTLAWRASGSVTVILSNALGRKIRTLVENAPAEGTVVWDGRDENGRIVPDGAYTFSLRTPQGRLLSRIVATLDTNRLPVHEAAGTGRITVRNLTCALPDLSGPAWMPAEDEGLFVRNQANDPEFPPGLLRIPVDGSEEYLFQDPWYQGTTVPGGNPVSPDGRELLVVKGTAGYVGELHAVDLLTGAHHQVADYVYDSSPVTWSPTGQWFAVQDRLYTRAGDLVRYLPQWASWSWSPDGKHLAAGPIVVNAENPDDQWSAPFDPHFDFIRTTEWRADGSVFTLLFDSGGGEGERPQRTHRTRSAAEGACDPEDTSCVNECTNGCAFIYTPFTDEFRKVPWLPERAQGQTIDWSAYGEKVLYTRYRPSLQRDVTEVAPETGSPALELLRNAIEGVSPHDSLGFYWSSEAAIPGGACYGAGSTDLFVARSLENLSVDFAPGRLPGNTGLLLSGVVSDRNLESWQLEYATTAAPEAWHPIGPSSDAPVLNDVLTAWVPPAPGTYALRLRARDLAGNTRSRTRVVVWDRYPSITNITQTEFLISPNADGFKDSVRFDYYVQEPTRLDVNVVGPFTDPSAQPPVVRTFSFEYKDIRAESFLWDGRDASGQVVPDGKYRVLLNGIPLRVNVDDTPPDIAFAFLNLRVEPNVPGVPRVGVVKGDRAWHVLDDNLKSWESPIGRGTASYYDPVRDGDGDIVYDEHGIPRVRYENGHAADLRGDQEEIERIGARSGMRFTARDRAGNRADIPVPGIPEKLFVLGSADPAVDNRVLLWPPIEPQKIYGLIPVTRVEVAETLWDTPPYTADQESVRFQFQADMGGPWTSGPPFQVDPTGIGELDFLQMGLDLKGVYRGRFACDAANGHGEFLSEAFRFRPCAKYMVLEPQMNCPGNGPPFTTFTLVTEGEDLGVEAWLDVDYEDGTKLRRLPMTPDEVKPGHFSLDVLGACVPLTCTQSCVFKPWTRAVATVKAASGRTYGEKDSDGKCIVLGRTSSCQRPGVSAVLKQGRGRCDLGPDRLSVLIWDRAAGIPISVVGDPDGAPFPIGRYFGLGPSMPPAPMGLLANVTGRPHGLMDVGVTIGDEGDRCFFRKNFPVFIDRAPPFGEILQPADGTSLCVSTDPISGRDFVPFVVTATDDSQEPIEVRAEFKRDGGGWQAVGRFCLESGSCGMIDSGAIAEVLWDVTPLADGEYTVRVTFCDRSGNRSVVERRVSLDRKPPYLRILEVSRKVFSPNGDGRADNTFVRVRLAQALVLTARVRADNAAGPVVRSLFSRSLPAGDHAVDWDGRADGGAPLPDGQYVLTLRAVNGCGREGGVNQVLEIDTRPPDVVIATPTEDALVSGSQTVRGVATDKNMLSWELAYSTPGQPWTRVTQATSDDGALGAPVFLANWIVPPGEGSATLRLSATDRAENYAEVLAHVTRASPNRLERVSAVPPLFSPNDDGRRETTTIEYSLLSQARVFLEIRTPGGAEVRSLIAGVVEEAGVHALIWDGLRDDGSPAPDAEYAVLVLAEAPGGGGTETKEAAVIVDRTPPAVTLQRPTTGSYVDRDGAMRGSISDLRLSSYVLATSPGPVELTRGTQNQVLADFAPMSGLADGPHTVTVDAEDQAENRTHVELDFVVDSIPPVVAIHEPAPGAVLLRSSTPISVNGVATDENLREWLLEAGPGSAPAFFNDVRRSATGGHGIELGPWAVSGLTDGLYTLRLSAEDLAAHRAETRTTVELDGTPPQAEIGTPAEGACVISPGPIEGVATDLHLEGWDLEEAPGNAGSAFQWSPVVSGTAAVTGGALGAWNPLPPDGLHTLRLTVRDKVGLRTQTLRTVTVDTVAPAAVSGLAAKVVRTGGATPPTADIVLTWGPSTGPGLAGYEVLVDGGPISGVLSSPTYTVGAQPEGVYVYDVVAKDGCGNQSVAARVTVKVDVTPPLADILKPAEGASVSGTVDVRGTAWSDDFKEYRLFVGAGAEPTSWALLRRSTLTVQGGVLGTWTALGEGRFTFALEAEDVSGNVARATRGVVVDNQPPLPPVLTSVEVAAHPSWLLSTWIPSTDPDVEGYLLYRSGFLANGTGIVIGDLRPYLVPAPTYLDKDLPDGKHCYRVVAMDFAGNLSLPSNEICRTLDNRPPHAEIIDPPAGTRFQFPIRVVAFTPDLDVARVQFQYKASAAGVWLNLGAPDTVQPWETTFDPGPLSFGPYDLRAVATDDGGRTDPAPTPITVMYGDTTPPAPPLDLRARVDERVVHLAWAPSSEPDVAGYHVYRDAVRITSAPVVPATFDDDRDPGDYVYTVTAVDGDGNESQASNQAPAHVFQLTLDQPFPVTLASTADVEGGNAQPDLAVELRRADVPMATLTAGGARFQFPGVALDPEGNVFTARGQDGLGNRSIRSEEMVRIANTAPDALTSVAASVDDHQVTVSWDASPAIDLFGYAVRRDNEALTPTVEHREVSSLDASSTLSSLRYGPERAFDGLSFSAWFPTGSSDPEPRWTVTFPSAVLVERVEIDFLDGNFSPTVVRQYDVEALWQGRYLPLAQVAQNDATSVSHTFPWPFATDAIRIRFRVDPKVILQGIAEVRVFKQDLVPLGTTTFVDPSAPDGYHDYQAAAVDIYGAYGPWETARVPVGDVTPPAPPIALVGVADGHDAVLNWTANTEPDIDHYVVLRDGERIGTAPIATYRDPDLANATYRYAVLAVDAVGNESAQSNPADVTIDVAAPVAPVLRAEALSSGVIRLDWDHPGAPTYVLFRSTAPGGPYAELARTIVRQYLDSTAAYGVRHYYVVRALDLVGNPSPFSNEADAIPLRTDPLPAPVILFPTDAAHPTTLAATRTPVRGSSEPGTRVSLTVNDQFVGEVDAQPAFTVQGTTQLPPASGYVLSSNGRVVAYTITGQELVWQHVAAGTATSAFTRDDYPSLSPVGLDPEGTRLLYLATRYSPDYQTDLYWLDLSDRSSHAVETGPATYAAAAWAPDGGRIAFSGTSDGTTCPLQLFDIASETTTTLFEGNGCAYDLAWSADGRRLAFVFGTSSGTRDVLIQDVTGGAPRALGETAAMTPTWSPEGAAIAYVTISGYFRVRQYDVAAGTASDLTDGTAYAFDPRYDPSRRWLSYQELRFDDNGEQARHLIAYERGTGLLQTIASASGDVSPQLLAWTTTGYAAILAGNQLTFLPGFDGAFELPSVRLQPGENVLVARARDPVRDLESPDSEPVRVDVPTIAFPDLEVQAAELFAYPAVPPLNAPASLRARVRNRGGAAAQNVDVHLRLSDPTRAITVDERFTLSELAPGGSSVVSVPWTPSRAGVHILEVVVDEPDAIAEAREDNNEAARAITVATTGGLVLGLDSDRPSYPAHAPAVATARLVNGGRPLAGTAVVSVEDRDGREVARLDERAVSLEYGQETGYSADWNTGTTYAGSYAFVLRVAGNDGSAGTARKEFVIEADRRVGASLRAEASRVVEGTRAGFHGRVDNLGVNVPQPNLVARLVIRPAAGGGQVYAADPAPVALLLPQASWERDFEWPSAAPSGPYVAELHVGILGEAPLAIAGAPFEVAPPTDVAGTVSAVPGHVQVGTSFATPFTVTNRGAQVLAGYPVMVEVVVGAAAELKDSQSASIDLTPGETYSGTFTFATTSLAPRSYTVRLRGGAPATTLARATLRVHGLITPPSIDSPPDGSTVTTSHPMLVVNDAVSTEGAPLEYEFQLFTDAQLRLALPGGTGIPEVLLKTSWRVTTNLAEDNVFYWRARATDGRYWSAWSAIAWFRVDAQNQPPTTPIPDTPVPGARVATRQPTLVVLNATDPEQDVLTYDFRLARDQAMNDVLASASGLAQGPGLTSWSIPLLLDEDGTYWWSARASDGRLSSAWSVPVSFTIDTENLPPTAPTPLRPVNDIRVRTLTPELVVANAVDPEGALLLYRFELDAVPSFDSPERQVSPLTAEGQPETGWIVATPLRDNTRYFWRASATDGHSFGPSAGSSFFVDLVNEPPGPPLPLDPVDGRAVPTRAPTLLARNAVDPEHDPLTYQFEVRDPSGAVVAGTTGVLSGPGETSWPVAPDLQEDQSYQWRARARDAELDGPWSSPAQFRVNAVIAPPTAPTLFAPAEGSRVPVRRPPLVVSNAMSPDGLALAYTFELYALDPAPVLVDSVTGVPEGTPRTSWTPSVVLPDGHYSWRARAVDTVPQPGPWMNSAHFTVGPPAPPTVLVAVPGDARVTLGWHASPDADVTGYRLYRSLHAGGPYAPIADTAAPGYLDTNVTNGTTYYYVVTALTPVYVSGYSNEAAATPQGATGPLVAELRYTPAVVDGECVLSDNCRQTCRQSVHGNPFAPDLSDRDDPTAGPMHSSGSLKPILECVIDEDDGDDDDGHGHSVIGSRPVEGASYGESHHEFTALFGYSNSDDQTTVSVGSNNYFTPKTKDRGQPTHFHPGRTSFPDEAFAVTFDGNNLKWRLGGQEAVASRNSPLCGATAPAVECPDWVLATIELPTGHDPHFIVLSSVRLAGVVPADPHYSRIVDGDHDGRLELEVRFAFDAVAPRLAPGGNALAVTGLVSGLPFSGTATIEVRAARVNLWFTPRTIQRSAGGQWVQAQLRVPDCMDARDIDVTSLRLDEAVGVSRVVTRSRERLIVKFDRAAVASVLPNGEHVEVRVSGRIEGAGFVARDAIRVIP